MKKILVIIQYAILNAIPYAIGFGLGEFIGFWFGLSQVVTFILAYVLLLVAGALGTCWLHWYERRHARLGGMVFAVALLIYIVFEFLTDYVFEKLLLLGLLDNLVFELGIGLIAFGCARLILARKRRRVCQTFDSDSKSYRNVFWQNASDRTVQHPFNGIIAGKYPKSQAVKCTTGIYVGEHRQGVLCFKGIPYAQAPAGELRWKAPQPLPPSGTVWEARHFSPIAPQPTTIFEELNKSPQSEDCLALNIWTSEKRSAGRRPVMVYLHGGELTFSSSSFSLHDGESFVRHNPGTVFVSMNFRQGLLGIMDFSQVPGGDKYPDSTDLPMLDQIAALRWLRENIAGFQGDPDNITLCGAESGGLCAAILATAPQARGLFRRIVMLSSSMDLFSTPEQALARTRRFMSRLHAETMEDLLRIPAQTLSQLQEQGEFAATWFVAGRGIVPANLLEAFRQGAARGIDVMCGTSGNSTSCYIAYLGLENARRFFNKLVEMMKAVQSAELNELYDTYTALGRKIGAVLPEAYFFDFFFYHSFHMAICRAQAGQGQSARCYRWNVASPIQEFGAFSGIEMPFLLDTLDAVEKYGIVGDKTLARTAQCSLAHFLKDGNPDLPMDTVAHNPYLHWPAFTADAAPVLIVGEDASTVDDHGISDLSRPIEELVAAIPDETLGHFIEESNTIYQEILKEMDDAGGSPDKAVEA